MPSFRQELLNAVSNASDVAQIIPILQQLPLTAIKNIATQELMHLSNEESRGIYYNSMALDHILPDDITQHIISFCGPNLYQTIDKNMQKLTLRNQRIHYKKVYETIETNSKTYPCKHEIEYNKNINSTWIVDMNRDKLYPIEEELEFKGPYHELEDILKLDEYKANDRIIIHAGYYEFDEYENEAFFPRYGFIHKNLQIIGIGDVELNTDTTFYIQDNAKVYMENINISTEEEEETDDGTIFGVLQLGPSCKLWAKNCSFENGYSQIMVRDGAELYLDACKFEGGCIGINISPIAKQVEVLNCKFEKIEYYNEPSKLAENCACIQIFDDFVDVDEENIDNVENWMSLKCIGNVFENNTGYPIVDRSLDGHRYGQFCEVVLKDNELKGYNATMTFQKTKIKDANELYESEYVDDF